MGLSASQSRVLTLTARLSDLELKAQDIQNQKIRLSEQSTAASKAYMDALDAQTLKFNYYSTGSVDATIESITASGQYRVADYEGKQFIYSDGQDTTLMYTDANGEKQFVPRGSNQYETLSEKFNPDNIYDSNYLFEQLKLANLYIQKMREDETGWDDYSYISSSLFTTVDDDTNMAKAEAEYEYTLAEIQSKDKRFDLDLDNIKTEHDAVNTAIESVKKVVEDNVGRTFKVFS